MTIEEDYEKAFNSPGSDERLRELDAKLKKAQQQLEAFKLALTFLLGTKAESTIAEIIEAADDEG